MQRVLLSALVLAGTTAAATDRPALAPALEDCIASTHARTLLPEHPSQPRAARAAWLDDQRLRWQVPAGTEHVRLLASPLPTLPLATGEVPDSAWTNVALQTAADAPLARFSHIPGKAYRLPAGTPLESLMRGTLLVAALDAEGRVIESSRIQPAGALDALHGVALEEDFWPLANATVARSRLWAPTAIDVHACLHHTASGPAEAIVPLTREPKGGSWQGQFEGDWRNTFYTYLVDVIVPGVGLVRQRVTDPYALGLSAGSQRTQWVDLQDPQTRPRGWDETLRPDRVRHATDLVIYELHVRDFSRDDATVPAPDRGKYLGFTHPGSDGMRHLRRLGDAGVTDIHLLPTYDLATVPERGCAVAAIPPDSAPDSPGPQAAIAPVRESDCFNWGYDPWHYTVPEGSYASHPDDSRTRIREFRAMVQALHRANLRVGLDVVYNHTMASGQDRQSVLDRIVPGYYHRLDAEGGVTTSTCCANTATENAMMAKLMIDSAVVWARDFHIDSFRFDLMGHQPKAAMLALQTAVDAATGRRIHLIGEGWNFGEVANGARFEQATQGSLQHSGIATFSDRMRDAARGGRAGDRGEALWQQGWLTGLATAPNGRHVPLDPASALADAADLVRVGLAGSLRDFVMEGADGRLRTLSAFRYGDQPAGYVVEPSEVVNYTENHDNLTLFDSNLLRLPPRTSRHDRARVQVLGNALVLLSQGIAYLHAGQEIMRSKSLDRNSYNSGDAFNRLDWTLGRNHFGSGLPPAWDNADSWPQMRPLLADAARIAPTPAEIRFVAAATEDLLRVRTSSRLLRLPTAADVRMRLSMLNTGPEAVHSVVAAHLDGTGLADAGFAALLVALNTDPLPQTIRIGEFAEGTWRLHPDLRADALLGDAAVDRVRATLHIPGRSAVVFVRD